MNIYVLIWTVFELNTPHPYIEPQMAYKNMEACSKRLVELKSVMEYGEGQCLVVRKDKK